LGNARSKVIQADDPADIWGVSLVGESRRARWWDAVDRLWRINAGNFTTPGGN
jgi:hypothetical protein